MLNLRERWAISSPIFAWASDANIVMKFSDSTVFLEPTVEELLNTGRLTRALSGLKLGRAVQRFEAGKLAARVSVVRPGSPAARAGFRPGDRVISAAGRRVRRPADFRAVMNSIRPPFDLPVTVLRNGRRKILELKIRPAAGR